MALQCAVLRLPWERYRFIHKYIVRYTQENGTDWYFEHNGTVLVQDDDGPSPG
jgi:hypothetical protein